MKQNINEVVDFDIDKICRVCLETTNFDLSHLFDEQNAVNGVTISEMISECTMYTVRRHDEFPHLICGDCMDKVRNAYLFKKQFETSHRTLIKFLESVNKFEIEAKPSLSNDKCIQTDESTLYPCEKCDDKFLNYAQLRAHRVTAHRGSENLCRICFKKFKRIIDLKNHIATRHPGLGHTSHECKVCNKKFTRKEHVNRHLRNIHKLEPEAENGVIKNEESDLSKNYTLNETQIDFGNIAQACDDLLSNYDSGGFEEHVSCNDKFDATDPISSGEEDEKPLASPQRISNSNERTKRHPGLGHTSHECKICKKKFTHKDDLNRHLRNIHKLQPEAENGVIKNEESDLSKYYTSNEMQIDVGNIAQAEPCDDSGDFEERVCCNENFDATDPISSGEEDEKPLASLQRIINSNERISNEISVKLEEPEENVDLNLPKLTEINVQSPLVIEDIKPSEPPQDSTNRKYNCNECDKSFIRNSHLKRHLLSHRDVKPFSCEMCEKRFSRTDHLKIHQTRHAENKEFQCDECGRSYYGAELLKRHKQQKHGENISNQAHLCGLCNRSFSSKNYLQKHMRLHSEGGWKCKLCPVQFESKDSLKEHAKSHSKEKSFLCSECGQCFMRKDYLLVHMRRHKGEKPYKCKYCDKAFPRATDLNVHQRYHTGEKTHLCTICGKGFQRGYNLVVHMRVHTGERPYKCQQCSKSFAQCNDLKAHIRRHTGERFKCELCDIDFIKAYNLTQHKFAVHGIEVESRIRRVAKILNEAIEDGSLSQADDVKEPFRLEFKLEQT